MIARRVLLGVVFCSTLVGCSSAPTRNPVPADLAMTAYVPGIEQYRTMGDDARGAFGESFDAHADVFFEQRRASGIAERPFTFLAISGGGQQGAFGAGILNGWTKTGQRPEFDFVTGISTGALTAPFAFLGPDYDEQLREIYTTVTTDDLVKRRGLLTALRSDAFANNDGLFETIQRLLPPETIDVIAREHKRGRRLLVQTANLDTMQPAYWSISGIAASGVEGRDDLIHRILLASAAIPGAFPPVLFEVITEDGNTYDEMHVDGGAVAQVFAYPLNVRFRTHEPGVHERGARPTLYVIRNAKIQPDYQAVRPRVFSILSRSTSSMIRSQGLGDLFRMYLGARRDGVTFNLAYIPAYFVERWDEDFDTAYMNKLYDLGEELAHNGYPWEDRPPGLVLPGDE